MKTDDADFNIKVVGRYDSPSLHLCKLISNDLEAKKTKGVNFEFIPFYETQFDFFVEDLLKEDKNFLDVAMRAPKGPIIYTQVNNLFLNLGSKRKENYNRNI